MSLDIRLVGPRCPHCKRDGEEYFNANITHNLNKMAMAAGVYKILWHPEELRYKKAKQLIPALTLGLAALKENPAYFAQYNSPNGWGMYENFVPFVERVLEACRKYPNALIEVSI